MTGPMAEFRSEDHPDTVVSIGGSEDDRLPVWIAAGGLSCAHYVVVHGDDGLPGFVAGLARDWRGWPGERRWHSLEEELTIVASHTGRRVELLVTLRRGIDPDAWSVSLPVPLAPGEALARAARDIEELFRAS
jgi:hypothetical protein